MKPRALLVVVAGALGCVTAGAGRRMRGELAQIRARSDGIDPLGREHAAQLTEMEAILDRATALLRSNTADVGAKEEKTERDVAAIQGHVDGITQQLAAAAKARAEAQNRFEARVAALELSEARVVDRVAPTLPDDPEQLWKQAGDRLRSGQRDLGRRFYRAFIQRYPQDPRAARAYLALGVSFAEETEYAKAAAELQRLLDTYPRAPEVPEAMWRLSRAFVELRFCSDARSLLRDIVKRFPKSQPAVEATREMRAIRHLPHAACTS